MKFKSIDEATKYFFSKIALTNNSHNEEEARLDKWLGEQEIEEIK